MAELTPDQRIRYLYYSDLHYIDPKLKDELWAAQCLLFSKTHGNRLLEPDTAKVYRDFDEGKINVQAMKNMFDPKLPDSSGGKAEYVATDWKGNPINQHLSNIVEAKLKKIQNDFYCKATDEFAKEKQQRENERILGRREFVDFLNEFNKQFGYPQLKKGDDPYKYLRQMQSQVGQDRSMGKAPKVKDMPTGLMDAIKASINDNEDLALFNEYIYKGDVEIAIELGIDHYFRENRFERKRDLLLPDLRNFNLCCGRWYTSLTTGLPVIDWFDPVAVYVSPFNETDGSDITFWFIEYDITYGDFERMFAAGLSEEQKRRIFEWNKIHLAGHQIDWNRAKPVQRSMARIRIGYHEWQTQNQDTYAERTVYGNQMFKERPFGWKPAPNTRKDLLPTVVLANYNVWYKCYYIPLNKDFIGTVTVEDDFERQRDFIFDFGKLQDQQRYGENDKLAKSSLVLYKGKGMSFSEIMHRYMGKIDFLWQKYQNLISQTDDFLVFGDKLLRSMMAVTDDANKQGKDSKLEWLKMLNQTGQGIAELTDAEGKRLEAMQHFSTGKMDSALKVLTHIQMLYDLLTRALTLSGPAEGTTPKPRTSLGGIQLSVQAMDNGIFFIEDAWSSVVLDFAARILKYMMCVTEEGGPRFEEMSHVIGMANGMVLESIKDIPKHRLGLHVDNVNTDKQKELLIGMATEMVKAGMLDIEALNLLIKVDNYKYASVLMILKYKEKQRKIEEAKQMEFQRQMQLGQQQLEITKALQMNKAQADTIPIEVEKKWEFIMEKWLAEFKASSQNTTKDVIKNNRIEEMNHKDQLERDRSTPQVAV